MEKVLYNGILMDKTERDCIISELEFNDFNFIREFAPSKEEEMNWQQVDELVKLYKDCRNSEDKLVLEEEIFRANFNQMYYFAMRNTYVIKGFNDEDVIPCMFMAHRYLLDAFKYRPYTKDGVKVDSLMSFRKYLKTFFQTKFHRYFVEGSGGFNSNTSLTNFKKRYLKENIFVEDMHSDSNKNTISSFDEEVINKIEVSDMDVRKELREEIERSLPKHLANAVLITFKLKVKGKWSESKEGMLVQTEIALKELRKNKKIKELFEYYINYLG